MDAEGHFKKVREYRHQNGDVIKINYWEVDVIKLTLAQSHKNEAFNEDRPYYSVVMHS